MQRGFTLIELLVVVAIISLLASIVMYSTSEAKLKADDAHMKAESDQVAKAIHLYKAEYAGKVPGALSLAGTTYAGQMLSENDPDLVKKQAYQNAMQELVDGGYLPEVPRSPDGASYSYMVTTDGESAVFAANLKTKSSSGSGGNSSAKNSCENIQPISENGFKYSVCTKKHSYPNPEADEWGFPNEYECMNNISSGDVESMCACLKNELPENQICHSTLPIGEYEQYINPFGIGELLFGTYYYICVLSQDQDTPVCSGGNDSDYCQCI